MTLSTDERRALALIAALILLASGARWLERPSLLLPEEPGLDVTALEAASRAALPAGSPKPGRPIADPDGRTPAGQARPGAGPGAAIDPNTAGAAELMRLPGVGPALAARIIEERQRAPFRSVQDLRRVPGIGAALAKRMALHVSLPDVPAAPERPSPAPATPVQNGSSDRRTPGPTAPFDINTIGSTDLQKVPGIGPVLAARILARRDALGRFSSWAQVDSVAGVGPAILSRLRESAVLR